MPCVTQAVALTCCIALTACGGDYGGGSTTATGNSGGNGAGNGDQFANSKQFFAARVQPRLDFCRNCHIPNGIADTDPGRRFMLSPLLANGDSPPDDYAKLNASWVALGRGVDSNRILLKASNTDPEPHSAGAPWPVGSDAYQDMRALLVCWDDPVACALNDGGGMIEELPLLGGTRGGNAWSNFCAGDGTAAHPRQPDDAPLPTDPRTLVAAGVNEGKAVAFNAYWRSCENGVLRPINCGQLREQAALGEFVGEGQGEIGSPTSFAGGNPDPRGFPASQYNTLWQVWGLLSRPDNFDELVAERYGSPASLGRNPYPLPGEDPNDPELDGGSGQLPLVFTQLRESNGRWKGEIGTKVCVFCHNGQLGTAADGPGMGPQIGGAGSIGDFAVASYDFAKAGDYTSGATAGLTIATNRGTGAIDFFQLGFVLFSRGDPELLANDKILLSQAIGTIKSPPWWNMAYRPQKFHGAILPSDSSRIDMAAYYDLGEGLSGGDPIEWVDRHAGPFQVWMETLPSPQFPRAIDTALAEQGAVLFHAKDLWAPQLNNPVPRPAQGNGACAGCHGAYSPRYVNDPAYLDSPTLAGIAAYTVPLSIIGTDPVYAEAMQSLKNSDGSVSPAIMNNDLLYCGLGEVAETTTPKMLAPPLWGIWAAAPYFHNGSVPNIRGVLDPSRERPRIWRRVSAPALRAEQVGQVVMGYDTDLARAFDFDKLGWKYDELNCGASGTLPFVDCDPVNPHAAPVLEQALGEFYRRIALLWNLPRADMIGMSNAQIEARKIYNSNEYSQGNRGHEFTAVLTDQERRALIEYLKTL